MDYEPYDLFDTLNLDKAETFLQIMGNPDISQQLYQDEFGHVNHSGGRGTICSVIEQQGF